MSKKTIIVSYHTPDPLYTNAAKKLENSINQFDLEYDIGCLPSLGNWYLNACQKQIYILNMMNKYPNRNIGWIDADSILVNYPHELMSNSADLATCWWNNAFDTTTYVKNDTKMIRYFEYFVERNFKNPYKHEASQSVLNYLLQEKHGLNYQKLSPTYGWVKGESESVFGNVGEPVIVTYLISRANKEGSGGRQLYPGKGPINVT
jgi:hypothetical protein